MTSRSKRKIIAEETMAILERGNYHNAAGTTVSIAQSLQQAIAGTKLYVPEDFPSVADQRDRLLNETRMREATKLSVVNATTLAAAHDLVDRTTDGRVLCLNFASAKNPGGGFLGGAQAQEESLARSSGLYACIAGVRDYYDVNRACGTCLYTDRMIYSPGVPVFRDDDDALLDQAYRVSMVTAPAVNRGAVATNEPEKLDRIAEVMLRRIEFLLSLAVVHRYESLVLGAWGCGVFRNDPHLVAAWFYDHLYRNESFRGAFRNVVFAVLDHSTDRSTFLAFQSQFNSTAIAS